MIFENLNDFKVKCQSILQSRFEKIEEFINNLFIEYYKDTFKFIDMLSGAEEKLFKNIILAGNFLDFINNCEQKYFDDIKKYEEIVLDKFKKDIEEIVFIGKNTRDFLIDNKEYISELKNKKNVLVKFKEVDILEKYWFFKIKNKVNFDNILNLCKKYFALDLKYFDKNILNIDQNLLKNKFNIFFNTLINERFKKWIIDDNENYEIDCDIENFIKNNSFNSLFVFTNLKNNLKYFEYSFFSNEVLILNLLNYNIPAVILSDSKKIESTILNIISLKNIDNIKNIFTYNKENADDLVESLNLDTFDNLLANDSILNENEDNEFKNILEKYINKKNVVSYSYSELLKRKNYFEYFLNILKSDIDIKKINEDNNLINFRKKISKLSLENTYLMLKDNTDKFLKLYYQKKDNYIFNYIFYLTEHVKNKVNLCKKILSSNKNGGGI